MEICHTIEHIRTVVRRARAEGKIVGFVPTMGALHEGHGSLIAAARAECGFVAVSIFVNPTQFGPGEDFARYPRTLQADAELCRAMQADAIFAPSAQEMYPQPQLTWVDTHKLTEGLCGTARPGHFRGVTTVCTKLFNIVGPDLAYFGQKDVQQAVVIRRMVQDLNLPLVIRVCPIVREPDGLAMSSRNRYLTADERQQALCLYKALNFCRRSVFEGVRDAAALVGGMRNTIEDHGGRVDYICIADPETLEPVETVENRVLAALAVYVGKTRLIDNFEINLNAPEKPVR